MFGCKEYLTIRPLITLETPVDFAFSSNLMLGQGRRICGMPYIILILVEWVGISCDEDSSRVIKVVPYGLIG